MYQEAIRKYLQANNLAKINLKAVLFDMDGVLFNSMPYHAQSWHTTMVKHGLMLGPTEAYLHEGRTGASTINIVHKRQFGVEATPELIEQIYAEKSAEFNRFPEPEVMPGALELLQQVKACGLIPVLVTGSGQRTLINRLSTNFPNIFTPDHMVTAFDVKFGKPNPEPYLMGLEKAGVKADEAIVVENAPLGVQAGAAAGIFTIAVNTGPIDGQVLLDAGANLLLPSMQTFNEKWKEIYQMLSIS